MDNILPCLLLFVVFVFPFISFIVGCHFSEKELKEEEKEYKYGDIVFNNINRKGKILALIPAANRMIGYTITCWKVEWLDNKEIQIVPHYDIKKHENTLSSKRI